MADAESITPHKTCSCCAISKPRDQFFRCAACKDGLRGECKECVANKQRAYNAKNAEQISAQKKRRYWENPDKRREKAREYGRANAERARERAKAWYWNNRERAIQTSKLYAAKNRASERKKRAAYRIENQERLREASREFYRVHKERLRPARKAAKAMRRQAGSRVTAAEVSALYEMQQRRCAVCRTLLKQAGYHLDHIMPLAKGGTNERANLQLLCPPCNLSKSAKHPIDFMQQRGFLL